MKKGYFRLFFVLMSFCVSLNGNFFESDEIPVPAPLNRQYLEFLGGYKVRYLQQQSVDGHFFGLIPSVHDLSHFKNEPVLHIENIPSSYDLRTINKLTPVRNQGNCGSCWAFATYGSLESYLMPSESRNYAEQNLIDHHGFDWGPCYGGNIDIATAFLSRWDGPIKEEDDPYRYMAYRNILAIRKHIQNVIYLYPRTTSYDNDRLKQAIVNYGGVYTDMYYKDDYYNSTYKSYYNPSEKTGAHAVVIVGWDDYFDRYKFKLVPSGNGAFIVRNSWGADWGDSGYFYVSYYDAYFARLDFSAAVMAEPATTYQDIYQYDPLGWTSSFGFSSSSAGYSSYTAWGANIFAAKSYSPLSAVSFYLAGSFNNYEIYIYKNVSPTLPRSGTLVAVKSGISNDPGYYTIPLDSPVPLLPGQTFSIVIKFITYGYDFPVPTEYRIYGYSSSASAHSGESFLSIDGNIWYDFQTSWGGIFANTNICIKGFAGYPGVYPPANFTLQRLENDLIFSKEYINRLQWAENTKNKTKIVKYRIYRKKKGADDSQYQITTELPSSEFSYADRGLKRNDLFVYSISCLDEYSRESDLIEISN